jgi:hypothetical protein
LTEPGTNITIVVGRRDLAPRSGFDHDKLQRVSVQPRGNEPASGAECDEVEWEEVEKRSRDFTG